MMTARQIRKTKEGLSFAIKLIIGIAFVSPLILAVLFSLQVEEELMSVPLHLIAKNPTLMNFVEVFHKVPLLNYLKNSLIVCVVAIVGQIIFADMAGYAFSFFDFPGKRLLFAMVLGAMMIPGEVVVITNFLTVQALNLTNTYGGLIITSLIGGTSIFMMRQYYLTLPKDYREAAKLDGCGEMNFLFKIATPLAIPTIASLAIYLFVHVYNAYFWPVLVTTEMNMRTVQVGISFLVAGDVVEYSQIMASAVVAIVPSVIAYIFGQDYIIKGMTSGGIKG